MFRHHALRRHVGGQFEDAFEWAVIDFECQHVDGGGFIAGWLRNLSRATNDEPSGFGPNVQARFINAGQFDTNNEVRAAAKRIERWLPYSRHGEVEELRVGELHRDVAEIALNFVQIAKWIFHRRAGPRQERDDLRRPRFAAMVAEMGRVRRIRTEAEANR